MIDKQTSEITELWEQIKKSTDDVYSDSDENMQDPSYVTDSQYYPCRVTSKSNKKFELLMASGIFEEGTYPVDYNPTKNYSTSGYHYIF